MPICAYCGRKNRLVQLCSGCDAVNYCNDQCQRKAWPTHKQLCIAAEPQEEFLPGEIIPPSYIPSDPFGDVEPLPARKQRDIAEEVQEFIDSNEKPKSHIEAQELIAKMIERFNIKLPENKRWDIINALMMQHLERKNGELMLMREVELQRINADTTYRINLERYDKMCRKFSTKMAKSIIEDGMTRSAQHYPDLRELLEFGLRTLRGFEDPLEPTSEETLVDFASDILAATEMANIEESAPCKENVQRDAANRTPITLNAKVGPVLKDATDPSTDRYQQEQAIRDYVKDYYLPLIDDASDIALLYPMTNDETGEVEFFSREEFNRMQQQNRDHVDYQLDNQENEARQALRNYLDSRVGFSIAVAPQRRGTSKSPTRGRAATPAAKPAETSSGYTSWLSGWFARPEPSQTQQVSRRGAAQYAQAAAEAADSVEPIPGRGRAPRIAAATQQRLNTQLTGYQADLKGFKLWMGVIGLASMVLAAWQNQPLKNPLGLQQDFRIQANNTLLIAVEDLRADVDENILREKYLVAMQAADISRRQRVLLQDAELQGFPAFMDLMHTLNAATYEDRTGFGDPDTRKRIFDWVDDLSTNREMATNWMAYLLGKEIKNALDEYTIGGEDPMQLISAWQTRGYLSNVDSARQVQNDANRTLDVALSRSQPDDPMYKKALELKEALAKYAINPDLSLLKERTEQYLKNTDLSLIDSSAMAYEYWDRDKQNFCRNVMQAADNIERFRKMPVVLREEFMQVFDLALRDMNPFEVYIHAVMRDKYPEYFELALRNDPDARERRADIYNRAIGDFLVLNPAFQQGVVYYQSDRNLIPYQNAFARQPGVDWYNALDELGGRNATVMNIIAAEKQAGMETVKKTDTALRGSLSTIAYSIEFYLRHVLFPFSPYFPRVATNYFVGYSLLELLFGWNDKSSIGRVLNARENALYRSATRYLGVGWLAGAVAFHSLDVFNLFYTWLQYTGAAVNFGGVQETMDSLIIPAAAETHITPWSESFQNAATIALYAISAFALTGSVFFLTRIANVDPLGTTWELASRTMVALFTAKQRQDEWTVVRMVESIGPMGSKPLGTALMMILLGSTILHTVDFQKTPIRRAILSAETQFSDNINFNNISVPLKQDVPMLDIMYRAYTFDDNYRVRFGAVWRSFRDAVPAISPDDPHIKGLLENYKNFAWPPPRSVSSEDIMSEEDFYKYVNTCQLILFKGGAFLPRK